MKTELVEAPKVNTLVINGRRPPVWCAMRGCRVAHFTGAQPLQSTQTCGTNWRAPTINGGPIVPAIIADAGEKAGKRFIEFFTATIRNKNTREAYARAIGDFFAWCHRHRLTLTGIQPVDVAAYIEALTNAVRLRPSSSTWPPSRMCFDWLISGGVMESNPAAAVRGPKHVVKQGKTPVLKADEARELLDSIIAREDRARTDRRGEERRGGRKTAAEPRSASATGH